MTALHTLFSKFVAWWQKLSPTARARWIFMGIGLFFLILLIINPKPWNLEWPNPETARVRDFAKYYYWFGTLLAFCGSLFLALIAPWWTKPLPTNVSQPTSSPLRTTPSWFWPLIGVAMFLTAFQGSQRLDFSTWDDEHYSLRRFVQGEFKPTDSSKIDSAVKFRTVKWEYTFYGYKLPNNHIFYSILAHFSFDVWKTLGLTTAEKPYSEIALRLPAYLFGILSLATLALLLKELGFPRAGVIGAWLLAIHPWHVRYASEGRGYSLIICLFPLLILFWMRVLKNPRWLYWAVFGFIEIILLYTYPAMLFTLLVVNSLTLLALLFFEPLKDKRWLAFNRWFFASAVAGFLFLWFYLPCIPQLLAYLESTRGSIALGTWWLQNFFSFLFSGVAWFKSKSLTSPQPELYSLIAAHPRLFAALLYSALGLVVIGFFRLLTRGYLSLMVAIIFTLPPILAYTDALAQETFLYEWYLIYTLPAIVALLAVGFDTLALPFRRFHFANALLVLTTLAFVISYWIFTTPIRSWLLTKPLQPMRESVLLTRPSTQPNYPGHERIRTASFNTPAYLYDPHLIRIRSLDDFISTLQASDNDAVPLYLNIGNPWAAASVQPEMFALTMHSPLFEIVAELPGMDPTLDRIVARYIPGSFKKFNLQTFLKNNASQK
ncbi:MAG: hypothetical protein ACK5LK_02715 [Chthoniobacterales bacterium]